MERSMDRARKATTMPDTSAGGFALRRRLRALADGAWRDTVTLYTPEPWLAARVARGAGPRPARRAGQARAPASSQ